MMLFKISSRRPPRNGDEEVGEIDGLDVAVGGGDLSEESPGREVWQRVTRGVPFVDDHYQTARNRHNDEYTIVVWVVNLHNDCARPVAPVDEVSTTRLPPHLMGGC